MLVCLLISSIAFVSFLHCLFGAFERRLEKMRMVEWEWRWKKSLRVASRLVVSLFVCLLFVICSCSCYCYCYCYCYLLLVREDEDGYEWRWKRSLWAASRLIVYLFVCLLLFCLFVAFERRWGWLGMEMKEIPASRKPLNCLFVCLFVIC